MSGKTVIPLIDLVFLTLGSVLAAMTQMERIEAIPVAVARVGAGGASIRRGPLDVVTVTGDGLTCNGQPVTEEQLGSRLGGRPVVLRAHRALATERTLAVLDRIARTAADVSLEVRRDAETDEQGERRP